MKQLLENWQIPLVRRFGSKNEEEQNDLPIEFLGLVKDYNGVDIKQTSRKIKMHAKAYLERFL